MCVCKQTDAPFFEVTGILPLMEQGLDSILALLIDSGGVKRQDKKHLIGNNQLGGKLQHSSSTSQLLELLAETPSEVINSVPGMMVHILPVWAPPLLLFWRVAFSGEHPISTKDNAPSVVGAPSSKGFGINSPALTLEEVGGDFSENLDLGLHISALTAFVLPDRSQDQDRAVPRGQRETCS